MWKPGDDFDLHDLASLLEHLPVVAYREVVTPGEYPGAAIIYLSPQIKDLTGYAVEEYKESPGLFFDKIVHPDDYGLVMQEAERTISTGDVYRQEYRMIHKDGHVVWAFDVSRLVHEDEQGRQVWDGINIDITEQKVAQEELELNERKYRDLVERLPATIYIMSGHGYDDAKFVYLNPQATPMGYAEEDYLRDPDFWKEIVHPDDLERVERQTREAMNAGRAYALEYREIDASGRVQWIRDEATLVRSDPDGTKVWQGLTIDITEQKEAERKLEETVELLRSTDRVRRELLAELVRAEEAERARIAADLHDDSVQSLTALALRLDLLRNRLDPSQAQALADVEMIRGMVDETVSRLRRMMFDLRPEVLDRAGLGPALGIVLERISEDTDITTSLVDQLATQPAADLRAILFRVARECLMNARKHAGARRIEVELASTERGTRVRVRDDGRGFDPEQLPRPDPGHLGFASMRERMESAGGRMIVTSSPGRGALVELWVPTEPGP